MNTNDFYKELFEKYALDEEKIRRNALKAAKTPAWKRAVSAHWKTAAGAAAAVAVTVAAVAYTAGTSPQPIDIVSPETMLTAYQRIHAAEQDYLKPPSENESIASIYVSFNENVCYSDMAVMLSAIPDSDDIDVDCLYLSNGTRITGKADIEAFAETSGALEDIAGVKLYAPVKSYRDIQDLKSVYLAEFGSQDINDDTFSPISDDDPLRSAEDNAPAAEQTTVSTTQFVFVGETTTTAAPVTSVTTAASDTTEPSEDTELADPDYDPESAPVSGEDTDTTVPADPDGDNIVEEIDEPDEPESTDTTAADTTGVPEETTVTEISVSVTEITDSPDVGLMTQSYQLNVENSLETVLVDDYAIVLTRSEAYFYKLGGIINSGQPRVCSITNPKVAYTGNDTVLVTGCGADDLRNVIVTLNTATDMVYSSDVKPYLGDSEIGTIHCSSAEGKYFLKAVSSSMTYLYEVTFSDDAGAQLRPLFEFSGAVSPAGYKNGRLWFTAADENLRYSLYSFDCANGVLTTECGFGTVCKVRRSASFESFLITASDAAGDSTDTFVFDVSIGKFIAVQLDGDAAIAVKNGVIYIGKDGKNYTVSSDGTLTETSASVSYISKPYSPYNLISSDDEKVVVAEKYGWG